MRIKANRIDRGYEKYLDEFERKAIDILWSGWYVLGKECDSFEQEFAAYVGSKYCVGVGSGLDALWLAVRALGIGQGDEVIVQGNTYIRKTEFVLINVSGSSTVKVDNGYEQKIISLNRPRMGVYLSTMVWKDMYDFSGDSVLLVLASEHYDSEEYIRNHDEFIREIGKC